MDSLTEERAAVQPLLDEIETLKRYLRGTIRQLDLHEIPAGLQVQEWWRGQPEFTDRLAISAMNELTSEQRSALRVYVEKHGRLPTMKKTAAREPAEEEGRA